MFTIVPSGIRMISAPFRLGVFLRFTVLPDCATTYAWLPLVGTGVGVTPPAALTRIVSYP